MSDDLNWTVKAYNFVDGEYVLAAWICGLKQKKADETSSAFTVLFLSLLRYQIEITKK